MNAYQDIDFSLKAKREQYSNIKRINYNNFNIPFINKNKSKKNKNPSEQSKKEKNEEEEKRRKKNGKIEKKRNSLPPSYLDLHQWTYKNHRRDDTCQS